ncbi:hypothetical protein ElyMa_001315500 [Elysia marginata]|uniref:Uncharacterized protein n=1 Tax=Elysia marginata TaxID=1093978 RepID=A0AAV4IJH0_9GAST|nr:hypothetical protein ElyMa_001315500 [Elysia marginata]
MVGRGVGDVIVVVIVVVVVVVAVVVVAVVVVVVIVVVVVVMMMNIVESIKDIILPNQLLLLSCITTYLYMARGRSKPIELLSQK